MKTVSEQVLLIEDEPQMRRFLRITLQTHGYRLIETATGPWFLKLTGPEATVTQWEAGFREFVNSAQ